MSERGYNEGLQDGISLWGRVCGKQGSCDTCPIGTLRGANVTCQEFAKQFPAKMVSILTEMDNDALSYYEEYCTRFPSCNLPIDVLAECTCRKAVFEGYLDCPLADEEGACLKCWQEQYTADVTELGE